MEALGSPMHTCIPAISHPKSMHSEMYPTTHIGLFTAKDTHINIHPLNMPSVVIAVYAATESSRVCQGIAIFYSCWEFHIHLCNVCAACLGLEQLCDRMDKNHSPEGPWALSHPREPGGGAGSEGRGVVCSLESETCPSPVLCKPVEDPEAGSRSQWVMPKGRGLQNRKGRSYWGL